MQQNHFFFQIDVLILSPGICIL